MELNKELCKLEACKYLNRTEFRKLSNKIYNFARKNKWLDEVCNHMLLKGNRFKRCIYAFEFPDNYVYVGLTFNINERISRHLKNSDYNKSYVLEHINNTGLRPIIKQLTNYIPVKEASELEEIKKIEYLNNGWKVLNKIKCGGIGGSVKKHTKEKCREEALKYKTKKDFRNKSHSVYTTCVRNNWIEEICSHMILSRNPKNTWTKEKCKEEALKYKTKKDFNKKSKSAYYASSINNWLNDVCKHMESLKVKDGTWLIKENCIKEALKYKTINDFKLNSGGAYFSSWKNYWLDDVCKHMNKKFVKDGTWLIKENCIKEALKYKSRNEFSKNASAAYNSARKNGWLNEICEHMIEIIKPSGFWTKEKCEIEYLKYNSKKEFRLNNIKAYMASYRNGWLNEFFTK